MTALCLRPASLPRVAAALATALLPASAAWAHDGHGLSGVHWHATDVWGFVALGALLGLALWIGRR